MDRYIFIKSLLLGIFLLALSCAASFSQDVPKGYQVIRHMKYDFLTYSQPSGQYVPVVPNTISNFQEVSFILDAGEYENNALLLCLQPGSYLFVEQQIVAYSRLANCQELSIDSLKKVYEQDSIFFTIYHPELNLNASQVNIVASQANLAFPAPSAANGMLEIFRRPANDFSNFFGLGVLILLIIMALLTNIYSKAFANYYNFRKAVAVKFREENLFAARPTSISYVYFLIFHSLLMAFVLITIFHFTDFWPETVRFLNTQSLQEAFKSWFMLAFLIFSTFVLKYIYIAAFGALFSLGTFSALHYYDFIRMSKVFFLFTFSCVVLLFYGFGYGQEVWLKIIIYTIVFFSVFRVIILYLKLLKFSPFRNLHLFLYICSTELLPMLIGFKIFFTT